MSKLREAVIAAVEQHHKRVKDHLETCEDNEDGYRKHGLFLMQMQEHEAALRNLCQSEDLDFDEYR